MLTFGCWHKVHDALTLRKDLASEMACREGFEPSTSWSVARRSVQLSQQHIYERLMTVALSCHIPIQGSPQLSMASGLAFP